MSKYTTIKLWNERYGNKEVVIDYAGREMKKSVCGNPDSEYHPTIDHIRPLSKDGCDAKENIEICHRITNEEKGDDFPHWKANKGVYRAERVKGNKKAYKIVKIK